jgi:hypothetical protein
MNADPKPEPDWLRRRRLAAVFGEVLPQATADDIEPGTPIEDVGEDWLKAQVPPHHGS